MHGMNATGELFTEIDPAENQQRPPKLIPAQGQSLVESVKV